MSGELQTIAARHGVATFVPRGRMIKIVNTYGKQVVSMWAFSLNQPPDEKDEDLEEAKKEVEKEVEKELGKFESGSKANDKTGTLAGQKDTADDPPEEAPEEKADDPPEQAPEEKPTEKKPWSSYLPSIPYRSKGNPESKESGKEGKKDSNEAMSKSWSSYLPTGKGFSTNLPDVKLPDSKEAISAFKASHFRDPNKSYAEQLYDFSKTPVGAASLAAATGSGTASSLYAAYTAYTKLPRNSRSQPPMEYLSIAHTRASSHHLHPLLNDTLLTNLRAPILTLIEDTTPGAHDTLTAACDANLYASLGVDKPEEHGSCAENLVLALKELNERVGLKGQKAVGADVTVNNAPTPVHLFMNAPIQLGDKPNDIQFKIEEPSAKKRSYVRFKAERDVVIVMSACPMDIGSQNGGRCMAANFVVEASNPPSKTSTPPSSPSPLKTPKSPKTPQKLERKPSTPKSMPTPRGGPNKFANRAPIRRDSAAEEGAAIPLPPSSSASPAPSTPAVQKKKPKKLERRGTDTTLKTSASK